ncbi:MAG: 50S ribosomal protein L22 [Candidatus Micrarchaeota archaeon]|nr:MAG: 50S ribosomal protein L22 [Candidatus Micrarchaeota archaeon]
MPYSYNKDDRSDIIFASIKRADGSYKDLVAICDNIKGLTVKSAIDLLNEVIAMKRPLYYRTHNKKLGHRHELNGKKGRWPVKESKLMIKILKNAMANAKNKGYTQEEAELMKIVHASANKDGMSPRKYPSKGALAVPGNHTMGYVPYRLIRNWYAKIEIGIKK